MAAQEDNEVAGKLTPAPGSRIKHIIGVISGKGGVGKSFISGYLGVLLARLGQKVAILDADITGASIPTAFGLNDVRLYSNNQVIYPAVSLTGIQIASASLLIEHPGDPIVWRGPMAANLALRFFTEVAYNADIMIIDCPPGTSDIQLSLMQRLPLDGLVLVMTPQGLVNMVAHKAAKMAELLKVPVIGGVMNMAYATIPNSQERLYPFGEPDMDDLKNSGIPLVATVPLDNQISDLTDHGQIEKLQVPYLDELVNGLLDYIDKKN